MAAAISTALTTSNSIDPAAISAGLEAARTREVLIMTALVFAATAVFGYLIARLALTPTRNALVAQKEFIGNVAHEVRTPLTIIKANTEVLMLEEQANKDIRAALASNLEELDRISDIINNLLTLNALIEPERLSFAEVDLAAVARRVAEKLSHPAQRKRVEIRTNFAPASSVWGNATALEQIATNLLKNALEHTRAGGEITIAAGPDPYGTFAFSVRDTGTGIRQEDLHRIFEPFYRGDRSRTRSGGGGSGLGLAIVHELVKLHNGYVRVESVRERGTTVTVTLPRGFTHT